MTSSIPLVLTFSASDPTCGAGLQADALTIASLGAHPLTVLTGLTAQHTGGVIRYEPLSADWIKSQLDALTLDVRQPQAIKAGVLGSVGAVELLRNLKAECPSISLVIDPVMASGRGDAFGLRPLFDAMKRELFPITEVLTPNWGEACALVGLDSETAACGSAVDEVAGRLIELGCRYVLIKGGHRPVNDSGEVVNTLYASPQAQAGSQALAQRDFYLPQLTGQWHGSGCTLASAIATGLARGLSVGDAVGVALEYTWHSLSHAFEIGKHQAIPDRLHWMQSVTLAGEAGDLSEAS